MHVDARGTGVLRSSLGRSAIAFGQVKDAIACPGPTLEATQVEISGQSRTGEIDLRFSPGFPSGWFSPTKLRPLSGEEGNEGLPTESHSQVLALTVSSVPSSLDSRPESLQFSGQRTVATSNVM